MTYTTPSQRLATELRAELARRKIPQIRLAELFGISQVSVSRRLNGETAFDVDELIKLAAFLQIDPTDLIRLAAA